MIPIALMLAQTSDNTTAVSTGFLQYGAIGLLALIAVYAAWMLWRRQEKSYDKEVERGDRLEAELLALNKLISTELSGHLVRATEAMREVTDTLRHRGDK